MAVYAVVAFRRLRSILTPERMVAASVLAAAVFAAQMLNWPIPGGTSLHFVGGALAGILFGPWLGFLVLAMVVTTQAIVFHDGGLTTLGANLFNMAVVDVVVGYLVYRAVASRLSGRRARLLGAFLAGWLGITVAGAVAGVEIGLSPSFPYGVEVTLPIMAGWHAVLGIVEGVITALVVDQLYARSSPLVSEAARLPEPPINA